MKKYLLISLAALGFAACNQSDDIDSPAHNGEVEESYIAINLMSADKSGTRAATDSYGYEEGTNLERKINSAYFFFFDQAGEPFYVTADEDSPATAPGTVDGKNHLSLTISNNSTNGMPNVSDIKEAVLVLSTYKGVYPSKIVAVLNWTPENKAYKLAELHQVVGESLGNDEKGYVMSNSVYMDGAGNIIDATPLTAANIKSTEVEALAAPVDIYVERTAAKVVLTASGKVAGTANVFDTQKNSTPITFGTTSEIDVYVQLHGWELYNDYSSTNLLKNIDKSWNIEALGLTWNDIPYYRCYWAQSQTTDHSDEFAWTYTNEVKNQKGFKTNYGFDIASISENKIVENRSTYTYCGENTNQAEKDGEGKITSDPRTKVILKGQLMQKTDDTDDYPEGYKPLELARWYGTEYAGNEALRIAVANSLKHTLYYKDGDNYISIAPEHLECVAGETVGAEAYEVGFQLSTAGQSKTWYQYSSATGYVVLGSLDSNEENTTATNTYLKNLEPALLYASGQTYYHIDIKHLGATGKTAEYGVVRNHVYQIDVQSITGYGSPVYNGFSNLEDPDYPQLDESSYVAARINVLSWKVVKQGVDIRP